MLRKLIEIMWRKNRERPGKRKVGQMGHQNLIGGLLEDKKIERLIRGNQ